MTAEALPRELPTRKRCTRCHVEKDLDEFHRHPASPLGRHPRCKACRSNDAKNAPTVRRVVTAAVQRRNHLKYQYGITPDEYDALLISQDGVCAICGTDEPGGRWGRFYVDHDHETSRVRGLLCMNCNMGLGKFKDDINALRSAIAYLEVTND